MSKSKLDYVNVIIAIIALVVAIVSISISYFTYKDAKIATEDAKAADKDSKTEKVAITAIADHSNYQTKFFTFGKQVIIPLYWELILTNNSEMAVSFTDVNVENVQSKDGIAFYSHLYDGLFASIGDFDANYIELPINLNSGESKKMYIRIGVFCDSLASKILIRGNDLFSPIYDKGKWIRFNEARIRLAENELDFYDNKASIVHEGENIVTYQSEAKNQQTFRISFRTGKNSIFTKEVKHYMMKE